MLQPKALGYIRQHLALALQESILDGRWPRYESYKAHLNRVIDTVLKDKDKAEVLSYYNILSIFWNTLAVVLNEKYPLPQELEGPLVNFIASEQQQLIIENIIQEIENTPREYDVYFPLPNVTELEAGEFELSNRVKIITLPEDERGHPQHGLLGLLAGGFTSTLLESGKTYILIRASGYADLSLDASALRDAFSQIKHVLYLGLIDELFKEKNKYTTTRGRPFLGAGPFNIQPQIIVLNAGADPFSNSNICIELPYAVLQLLNNLEINTQKLALLKTANQTGGEAYNQALKTQLPTLRALIQTDKNNKDALPIRSALEWVFDAEVDDNKTHAFVKICIGLEAILGEESMNESLTEKLADRCAYLLSNRIGQRKEYREVFRKLYRIRSKIVHGRVTLLRPEEEVNLTQGQHILDAVIKKEISYLRVL